MVSFDALSAQLAKLSPEQGERPKATLHEALVFHRAVICPLRLLRQVWEPTCTSLKKRGGRKP